MPWFEWRSLRSADNGYEQYIAELLDTGAGLSVEEARQVPGGVRIAHRTDGELAQGQGSGEEPWKMPFETNRYDPRDPMGESFGGDKDTGRSWEDTQYPSASSGPKDRAEARAARARFLGGRTSTRLDGVRPTSGGDGRNSAGRARRSDAAPYGMTDVLDIPEPPAYRGDDQGSTGYTRRGRREGRPSSSGTAPVEMSPKGLVEPLPPPPVEKARQPAQTDAPARAPRVVRRASGGSSVRIPSAASPAGRPGVAVRRRRVRVSVPPAEGASSGGRSLHRASPTSRARGDDGEGGGSNLGGGELGEATPPPPTKRRRSRASPPEASPPEDTED